MKVEKLLGVPRSSRTIQLVINVPEAIPPSIPTSTSASQEQRPKGWGRVTAIFKAAVPGLAALASAASIAALVVSIYALNSQNAANQSSATQTLEQQAEKVGYTLDLPEGAIFGNQPFTFSVQNTSPFPVSNVLLTAEINILVAGQNSSQQPRPFSIAIVLGTLPGCSIYYPALGATLKSITMARFHITAAEYNKEYALLPFNSSISFVDHKGMWWQYYYGGPLKQITNPFGLTKADETGSLPPAVYKVTPGCS